MGSSAITVAGSQPAITEILESAGTVRKSRSAGQMMAASLPPSMIQVRTGAVSYEVIVEAGGLSRLASLLPSGYSKIGLLSSDNLLSLYGKTVLDQLTLPTTTFPIPSGEEAKSLKIAEICWQRMAAAGFDRRSLLLTLGGGSIGDVGGFIAACYMRGVDFISLPTTLLAMVDASIGGKTAVNFAGVKNLIGAFHQPKLVLADTNCLSTLPEREFWSGVAEVIKYAVIADAELFTFLEEKVALLQTDSKVLSEVIRRCIAIKRRIVSEDERESGFRAVLNFGHTFGHAFESLSGYKLFHGEAISIGMVCASQLAQLLGLVDDRFVERLTKLCQAARLPTSLPKQVDIDALIKRMHSDKKASAGGITFILPEQLGHVRIQNSVDPNLIRAVAEKSVRD